MQSHASRHVVSEHLRDRHPDQGRPFPKVVIQDEIAEAYGRRSIPKLTDVLRLDDEELPDEDRVHCLKVFTGLLSTQETKIQALQAATTPVLIQMLGSSTNAQVRRLCCIALESLATIMPGRQVLEEAKALEALTAALKTTPDAAVKALKVFSASAGGSAALQRCSVGVVAALVELIGAPGTSYEACLDAATTLLGMTSTEAGVLEALQHGVPRCLVVLSKRALRQELAGNALLLGVLDVAARCLCQLCSHADGKAAVRNAEGVEALGKMLAAPSPSVVQHAAGALMAISIEPESKVPVMTHAGAALMGLLRSGSPGNSAAAGACTAGAADGGASAAGAGATDADANGCASGSTAAAGPPCATNSSADVASPASTNAAGSGNAAATAASATTACTEAAVANARAALLNVVQHLDARRKLELLMPPGEAQLLLGQLPTVPPDYKYVVQAALTPVPAMLAQNA